VSGQWAHEIKVAVVLTNIWDKKKKVLNNEKCAKTENENLITDSSAGPGKKL